MTNDQVPMTSGEMGRSQVGQAVPAILVNGRWTAGTACPTAMGLSRESDWRCESEVTATAVVGTYVHTRGSGEVNQRKSAKKRAVNP